MTFAIMLSIYTIGAERTAYWYLVAYACVAGFFIVGIILFALCGRRCERWIDDHDRHDAIYERVQQKWDRERRSAKEQLTT